MTKMFKFLLCALAALTFLGCGDGKDYGNIHYDRDVCEHCQMAISDNRFAVDVRVDGKNHYFDDIGCLVEFMVKNNKLGWLQDAKIYINDASGNGEFIDARSAYFYKGFKTPMEYGWGAFKNKQEGKQSFSFDQVVTTLKASGGGHMHNMGHMHGAHDMSTGHGDMGGMKDPHSAEHGMSEPKHDMSGMGHTHGSDHGMRGDAGSTAHSQGAPHDMGHMHESNGTAHDMHSGHAH